MSTAPAVPATAPDAFAGALTEAVTPDAYLQAAHRSADMPEAGSALRVWESEGGHLRRPGGWTPAVALADLPDETAVGVTLAGRPVCLARSSGQDIR